MRKRYGREDPTEDAEFWEEAEELTYYRYYVSEPMIEVRDEGQYVKVIMEASGSRKDDVSIDYLGNYLMDVSLKYRGRHIKRRVTLPVKVSSKDVKIKVKNGVAQIILKKAT